MTEDKDKAGKGIGGSLAGGLVALAVVVIGFVWWSLGTAPPEVPAPQQVAAVPDAQTPAPAAVSQTPEAEPAAATMTPGTTEPPAPAETAAAPEATPPVTPEEPAPAVAAEGVPADESAPAGESVAADETVNAPAAAMPAEVATFDALRVSPDGALTVAGKTAPDAQVEVLLDGKVIDMVTADPAGAFASVVLGDASAQPRTLTVRVTGADGVAQTSTESLTVAPSPLAVAQAATAAGDTPDQVAEQVAAAQALADKPIVSDGEGARVLAGQADTLVIDTLAFDGAGRIAISGRGAPTAALLRAYIDNDEAGLVQAGLDGGWRMQLPAAKPGKHVLRVDALDAAGKVLTRAETEFEAVVPAELAAAASATEASQQASDEAAAPEEKRGVSVAGAGQPRAEGASASPASVGTPHMITVEKGSTLWAIARATYGDPYLYVRVFEANRDQIRNPDLIYPGQVFTLPE